MIVFNDKGIYCKPADVYIDPWKPVKNALISHAHGDHAISGCNQYLAVRSSVPILKHRLGTHIKISSLSYGEVLHINGVKISFHPAGHIVGSAQIRLEYKGEVWVCSGDYKLENDGLSTPFESVKCHKFITESTFGHPSFQWKDQSTIIGEINTWWKSNANQGITSVMAAYSLGKAQRLINNVDHNIGIIHTHGAVENVNEVLRKQGIPLMPTQRMNTIRSKDEYTTSLVIVPPAVLGPSYLKRFKSVSTAIASGWMSLDKSKRKSSVDIGFALSDHADWNDLNTAIKNTGAEEIYVTHGFTELYSKYLNEQGYKAIAVNTRYAGEEDE